MSAPGTAVQILSSALDGLYPPALLQRYDLMECLGSGHGTETFLAQEKPQGRLCVVKRYDRGLHPSTPEGDILRCLHHGSLPVFYSEFSTPQAYFVVRQYVQGLPLDQFMLQNAPSTARIVGLCMGLCDLLTYLHSREKPVIHRDIKPQNLIVRPEGSLCLIDFDIAREYDPASRRDTRCLGTHSYAPPEQYGFSQTDGRADIYSLGVLLCWMLTGSTDLAQAKIADPRLGKIVRRCTAFAPQDRYPNADQVKRALERASRPRRSRGMAALGAAALLMALGTGFALGRYTPLLSAPAFSGAPAFQEPLMEAAVRVGLGLAENEPLSGQALASLRELYIFGEEVSASQAPFGPGLSGERKNTPAGHLSSLEDVRLLTGLRVLYVNHQTLSDISALEGLEGLTRVDLRHTRVKDVSALAEIASLVSIQLYDTDVTDVSCLSACPNLQDLEVGGTLIASVNQLGGQATLKNLSLSGTHLSSLGDIGAFRHLETICLAGTGLTDLTPLLSLPHLQKVVLDETMEEAAQTLEGAGFQVVYE